MSLLPTAVFNLSHADCDKLRAKLQTKSDDALEAMDFGKHAAYQEAIRILHEERMEAYQRRSEKRHAKRRQALDSLAAKDG